MEVTNEVTPSLNFNIALFKKLFLTNYKNIFSYNASKYYTLEILTKIKCFGMLASDY